MRRASLPARRPRLPAWRLPVVLLLCAAGAVLVLWAASHAWAVTVTPRPAPLGALRTARSGGELLPWLPALGWAALGATGALLATRRAGRIVVGVVLAGCGLGALAGAADAVFGTAGADPGWPVAGAAGALALLLGGAVAIRHGGEWPVMGTRYDSPTADRAAGTAAAGRTGPAPVPRASTAPAATQADLWNALDRGEDPTATG